MKKLITLFLILGLTLTAYGATREKLLRTGLVDTFSEVDALVADKTLVNEEDAITLDSALTIDATLYIKEQAEASADVEAYGQVWVDTATPNTLWFTNDAGTDVQLGVSGSGDISSVGDVASGAAFDGTQGTTLTFYNVGGNATLAYDGTTITPSVFITSNVTGALTGKADTSGNADTVTNGVYTTDFPLNQDTTGSSASCTGESATVATITGLAPDTQNTYARTQYLIPYASTTTAFGEIAIGTDGQVLTSAGAGVAPAFETPAAAGATTELDNLGTVAINTNLISDTDSTDDLGSSAKYWANAYIDEVYTPAIQFPATAVPSADPNTIDDYEEGEYEPTVTGSTSGSYTTSTFTHLAYTKIGRVVTVQGKLTISGETSPVGVLKISLPFAVTNLAEGGERALGTAAIISGGTAIPESMHPYAEGDWSYFYLLLAPVDGGGTELVDATQLDAAFSVLLSYTYISE